MRIGFVMSLSESSYCHLVDWYYILKHRRGVKIQNK